MLRRTLRALQKDFVQFVDRNAHGEAQQALKSALASATFIALDCEFTGIPDRTWTTTTPQEAYDYVREFAGSYALMQVGISVFKNDDDPNSAADVYSFYIAPDADEVSRVNPRALQVLAQHDYSFHDWLLNGIPARDFAETFNMLLDSKLPIVGFHCLLDLVLCFARFVCGAGTLPPTAYEFLALLRRRLACVIDLRQLVRRSPGANFSLARHYSNVCEYSGCADLVALHRLRAHEAGVDSYMTGVCYAYGQHSFLTPSAAASNALAAPPEDGFNKLFMYGVPFCFDVRRPRTFEGYERCMVLSVLTDDVRSDIDDDGTTAASTPPRCRRLNLRRSKPRATEKVRGKGGGNNRNVVAVDSEARLQASSRQLPLNFAKYAHPPAELHWLVYRKRALLVYTDAAARDRARKEYGSTISWVALPTPGLVGDSAVPGVTPRGHARRRRRCRRAAVLREVVARRLKVVTAQAQLLAAMRETREGLQRAAKIASRRPRRAKDPTAAASTTTSAGGGQNPASEAPSAATSSMFSRIRAAVGWDAEEEEQQQQQAAPPSPPLAAPSAAAAPSLMAIRQQRADDDTSLENVAAAAAAAVAKVNAGARGAGLEALARKEAAVADALRAASADVNQQSVVLAKRVRKVWRHHARKGRRVGHAVRSLREQLGSAKQQVDLLTQGIDGYRAEAEKLRLLLKNTTKAMEEQTLQRGTQESDAAARPLRPDAVGPPVPKPAVKPHTALRSTSKMRGSWREGGIGAGNSEGGGAKGKDKRLASMLSARRDKAAPGAPSASSSPPAPPSPPPVAKRERNPYMSAGPELQRPKQTVKFNYKTNTWTIENHTGPLNIVFTGPPPLKPAVFVLKNCTRVRLLIDCLGAAVIQDCKQIELMPCAMSLPPHRWRDCVTQIGGAWKDVTFGLGRGQPELGPGLTMMANAAVEDATRQHGFRLVVSPPSKAT